MERFKNMKPLHIYLIGSLLSILSGIILRPFSEMAHTFIVVLAIGICLLGIVKHLRT